MALAVNCPGCGGFMVYSPGRISCSECTGENSRKSYDLRTGHLAGNLRAAAIEEARLRFTLFRARDKFRRLGM